MLSDYCDGSVYKNHRLYSLDEQSLQIMMYYDDVEVCNPLGSRAKKHKLGEEKTQCLCICYYKDTTALFYYTLGNISPRYRSSLRAIQLLAVLKTSDLQKYGCRKVLEQFMDDIKLLEQVINLNTVDPP